MKWFVADSVFDSIRPVYRAGKLIGIFTHTIDFRRQMFLTNSRDQVLLVVAILMDVYALTVSTRTSYSFSNSILLNVGIFCSVNLGIIISLSVSLCNRLVVGRMFRLFNTLDHVDQILVSYGYRLNHQLNHLLSCIYMVAPILINFLMMISTFFIAHDQATEQFTAVEIIVFLRSSLVFTIYGSYICVTLTSIYMRFRGLNKVISNQFPMSTIATDPYKSRITPVADGVATVRCIGDMHEKLSESIVDFNYCFALQILLMMASAFGYTLFSIFGIIHALSQPEQDASHQVSMNNMVYGCIYLSFIIQVVVAGSLVTKECKRTVISVHKAICYGYYDVVILRQIKFLSQQLHSIAPRISCLLFDFEWPFLISVAATLVMHVVILVQFDLSIIANKV
uniref:Gustatory receptor n=1 Tax=Anopheles christyi TaxID=43041 RepID=A0A182JRQ5_9DIPT